jgi:hypothetical protein
VLFNPLTMALYGQRRTTINFVNLMNAGGAAIFKLGGGPRFSATLATFTARAIVHRIIDAAAARQHGPGRLPCFVVCDEFGGMVSKDFETMLDTLRGYGVYLIAGWQHLDQLNQEGLHVCQSMLSNTRSRMVFHVSRADAEILASELWTGFGEDRVIETMRTPFLLPVERRRLVPTVTATRTKGRTTGDVTADHWQHAFHDGWADGDALGEAVVTDADGNILTTMATGGSHAQRSGGSLFGFGGSHARIRQDMEQQGRALALQHMPFYEYELQEREAHRRAWSVEQLKEQRITALQQQGSREYYVQLFEGPPVPMRTADRHPPRVGEEALAAARAANDARFPAITDVVHEVLTRVPHLLAHQVASLPPRRPPRTPRRRSA